MSFMYFVFYFSVIFSLSTNLRVSTFGCLCVCVLNLCTEKNIVTGLTLKNITPD